MMNKTFSALMIVAGLIFAPVAASAASAWHQGNGDVVTFTPEHIGAKRQRAEVRAEVNAASEARTLGSYQRGVLPPARNSAAPKTRVQVIEEMRNQTPEQLRAQKELFGG
jgi:hypothetical protein